MVFSAMVLNPLNDGRDTHAAADAQRDERATRVAALELVDHGAGDHGAGAAIEMAPPLTLSFSSGMLRSFWNFSTTDANASFNSNRSMSSTVRPARPRNFFVGGVRAGS